ncbi:MAG: 4-alpha-glucanotransferase [Burkholderiales bacterium]|nr:4-alpha-glucanotransferase [Burkholderiales bacterium]
MSGSDDRALDALCARHGIALTYRDIWNQEHATPEPTKHALLAAMGVRADEPVAEPTPADATVTVVHIEGDPDPEIAWPAVAQPLAEALRWTLALESGTERGGDGERVGHGDGVPRLRCVGLAGDLPPGYHTLTLTAGSMRHALAFIACPRRGASVPGGAGARHFGPAIQLYALRSRRNWGIGDFTDLANLARLAAAQGASFVGVNPLHELFVDRPQAASPYSPSSRLTVNPLYLDVEATDDYATTAAARALVASPAFADRLAGLRAAPLVDYVGVAAAKREVLAIVYAAFRREQLAHDTPRGRAFRAFAAEHRDGLASAARFDALQARFAREHGAWGWPAWPADYRDRADPQVAALADQLAADVDYHLYLQWQADLQLAEVAKAARDAGMAIGLYRDLAVGANPGGAETWHDPQRFAPGVHVGAPPDEFNQGGQDWGLPPWTPHRLAADGFRAFRELIVANLRHAGGLRIDHVMGLARLYWIPEGASAAQGAYVRYPLREMLGILALESHRHGALVVGEDLGTVPDDFRLVTAAAGILSYRVLYFERQHDGEFLAPAGYPAQALVTISTHDLPTLEGYWQGTDLAARDALALFPSPELRARAYADRAADRERLPRALAGEGLAAPATSAPRLDADVRAAVHAYVARTPCALMTFQLEDVFGETEQVNLPATTEDMQPNWRRKVARDLEDWLADGHFAAICAAIRGQRPGP